MSTSQQVNTNQITGRFHGDLPERTFQFAVRIVELFDQIPNCTKGWVLGKQLLRSGTSVGANIREADHALTDAQFTQRCSVARKETSESDYWLSLCVEAGLLSHDAVAPLQQECAELVRILSTIIRRCQTGPSSPKRHAADASRLQVHVGEGEAVT
ncbi:MAG: four helix bundle protein [Phycisphaerales bacterium]|nr:four helix bundle protein [Phycisphaerales bacterium]